MKYLKKTLSLVLALAMVFTMVIVPRTRVANAADDTTTGTTDTSTGNYTYFNTTMFKYDTETFNTATKALETTTSGQGIYFNDGGDKTTISGTSVTNENYNKWTGKWDADGNSSTGQDTNKLYACPGIVENSLDQNGQIVFKYPEAGIFDTTKTTGKSTYTNVEMPFKKDANGYYYYNSDEYDVMFPDNKPQSNVKLLDEGSVSHVNDNDTRTAFLPFSQGNNAVFHFGMSMTVNFCMTSDGQTYVTENGQKTKKPIKFEFSGDDDVWVFIDNKLVLDIGGIHDRIDADIDFSTGKATVYKGQTTTPVRTTDNIYTDVLGASSADEWRANEDKVHTLQIFYLERGKGQSNCKIKFNLIQKDKLEVTKALGNTATDDADLNALLSQTFNFKIYQKTGEGDYSPYATKEYYIYQNGSNIGTGKTDENGCFQLGFNQTALFRNEDISQGNSYKVEEIVPTDAKYTSSWKTYSSVTGQETSGTLGQDATIQTKTRENATDPGNSYKFTFTNTFEATLNDDLVVLDYGKPVKIDVLANDVLYGSTRKIKTVDDSNCTNGTIVKTDDEQLKYTPTKYMNSIDKVTYSVYLDKIDPATTKSANVSIMPASSVYYEDDFGTDGNTDSNVAIVWSGKWDKDGTSQNEEQGSDNSKYGWDDSYSDDKGYSNGSAHYSSDSTATATFRFTGTGVDVYSKTNKNVGRIIGRVKKVEKNGDTETLIGKKTLTIDNQSVSGEYYQIPTLTFENLEYGTYEVTIKVSPITEENRAVYYLDGIRVYNPLQGNAIAEDAYNKAGEANAQYIQVRKDLLDSTSVTAIDSEISGSVFIDKSEDKVGDSTNIIGTYETYGPKNEVYLKSGQGVAFTINNYNPNVNKVFIGLKSPTGNKATAEITSGTQKVTQDVSSASDLYYEITPTSDGKVVITNTTNNLLSITKLRITTSNSATAQSYSLMATPALMSYVDDFDTLEVKEETTEDKDTTLDEDDVVIDNPSDSEGDNTESNNIRNKINAIWNSILNSIRDWFEK